MFRCVFGFGRWGNGVWEGKKTGLFSSTSTPFGVLVPSIYPALFHLKKPYTPALQPLITLFDRSTLKHFCYVLNTISLCYHKQKHTI